jgi:hypothetical protein
MLVCSTEQCAICSMIEGSANCLRRQAHNCVIIAKNMLGHGVRDTLEQLSLNLMDEARTVENEQKIPTVVI